MKNGSLFINHLILRKFRGLATIVAITSLCLNVVAMRAAEPVITIKSIPPIGQSGNAVGTIVWDNLTAANAGQYAVIAMLHALWEGGGGYYVKPYDNQFLNVVDANGNFSILITTGGIDTEVNEVIFYFVERAKISSADVANPTTMVGKYLTTRTIYRCCFEGAPKPPTSTTPVGFVPAGTRITLSGQTGGAIFYTTDGSNPLTSTTAQTYNNQTLTVPNNRALLIKAVVKIENEYSDVASLLWFPKEPLNTKFWGLNVSLALNGEYFGYQLSEAATRERMAPVIELAKWVRTFGTLNNGLEYVNKIAKEAGLHTMIGLYITNNASNNNAQIEGLRKILQLGPPPDLIAVGNETSLSGVNPETLESCIDEVRDMVLKLNLLIPVGSVELANISLRESILEKLDFLGVNIYHGVWDNTPESQMLSSLKQTYEKTVSAFPSKLVFLTETGAPYSGGPYLVSGVTHTTSEEKAYNYLCGFIDWISEAEIPSFYFEAYDEPVKSQGGHPIEQFFGIMSGNLEIHPFYIPLNNETEFLTPTLMLSPNPFTDKVLIQGAEGCSLTVFTESGVNVFTQKITGTAEIISLDQLSAGIYFFYFEKAGKTKTVKALKFI